MRSRALSLIPLVLMLAAFGNVSGAGAVTLFTTPAHTTLVPVGSTGTATTTSFDVTSGTTLIDHCNHSVMTTTITQNNGVALVSSVTNSAFNACAPQGIKLTGSWLFTATGPRTVLPTKTCQHGFIPTATYDIGTMKFHTTGMWWTECTPRTAATSPISFNAEGAGPLFSPLTNDGTITASYTYVGTAATWSLT
jgi:hypothetical protein